MSLSHFGKHTIVCHVTVKRVGVIKVTQYKQLYILLLDS